VKQNFAGSAANGFQRAGSMATGFPAPSLVSISLRRESSRSSGSLLNSTFDVISPDLREGTLHSWNVAFQRQLPFSLTADIAYVGNRGVNLVMDLDNQRQHDLRLRATPDARSSRSFGRTRHQPHPHQSEPLGVHNAAPGESGTAASATACSSPTPTR